MGAFTQSEADIIRVLDPGCGTAILTCALLERLDGKNKNLERVDLLVYETGQPLSGDDFEFSVSSAGALLLPISLYSYLL